MRWGPARSNSIAAGVQQGDLGLFSLDPAGILASDSNASLTEELGTLSKPLTNYPSPLFQIGETACPALGDRLRRSKFQLPRIANPASDTTNPIGGNYS